MLWTRVLAIVRQEMLETRRERSRYWLFGIVLAPLLEFQLVYTYLHSPVGVGLLPPGSRRDEIFGYLITLTYALLGPVLIPMLTYTPLARRFLRDQNLGAMLTVLATGVQPGILWLAKLIAVFSVAYVVLLLGLIEDIILVTLYVGVQPVWSASLWTVILLSGPVSALGVSAVSYFLSWWSRTAMGIGGYVPAIISLALWTLALTPARMSAIGGPVWAIHGTALISIGAIVALTWAANKMSRERIAGLS